MGRIAYLNAPLASAVFPAALSNSLSFTLLQKISPEKVKVRKVFLTVRHQTGAIDDLITRARITFPFGVVQNVDKDPDTLGVVLPYDGQQIWTNFKIVTDVNGSFLVFIFPYTNGFSTPYAAGSTVQFSCMLELEIEE